MDTYSIKRTTFISTHGQESALSRRGENGVLRRRCGHTKASACTRQSKSTRVPPSSQLPSSWAPVPFAV
ncbi:hypothetical protein SRHO_G00065970 [Serrasalmus rhombeus]